MLTHAFLSDGRLFVRDGDGTIREAESAFVRLRMEEAASRKASRGWKSRESGASPYPVWGSQTASGDAAPFRFTEVRLVNGETLFYCLTNRTVAGLFRFDAAIGEERRLFHRNEYSIFGIDYSQARAEFVAGVADSNGAVNLEMLNDEGRPMRTLTDGDSRDTNAVFSRADAGRVLYQSAGIARDESGTLLAIGPESICALDMDSGEVHEVLGDDRTDYLLPRDDAQGNVYCIRRPWKSRTSGGFREALVGALLFPFRFLMAVVGFLNAFTMLFNRDMKPAGGPNLPPANQDKFVRVFGQTISMARLSRSADSRGETALVPGNYELIRVSAQGDLEVLARNVSWFDVQPDGAVEYTNGFRVRRIAPGGDAEVVFKHPLIESLSVAPEGGRWVRGSSVPEGVD